MTDYIFDRGAPVTTGFHGETDYVFASGEPVPNNDVSNLVFESGFGLGGAPQTDLETATGWYISGGQENEYLLSISHADRTVLWEAEPLPTPVHLHTMAELGETVWLVGGNTNAGLSPTDTVQAFDIREAEWVAEPPLPVPLTRHGMTAYDGDLLIAGGFENSLAIGNATGAVRRYDTTSGGTSQVATMPDYSATTYMTSLDGDAYILTGNGSATSGGENGILYRYDGSLTRLGASGEPVDDQTVFEALDSSLYHISRSGGNTTVRRYDTAGGSFWQAAATASTSASNTKGAFVVDGQIGFGNYGGGETEILLYDPAGGSDTIDPYITGITPQWGEVNTGDTYIDGLDAQYAAIESGPVAVRRYLTGFEAGALRHWDRNTTRDVTVTESSDAIERDHYATLDPDFGKLDGLVTRRYPQFGETLRANVRLPQGDLYVVLGVQTSAGSSETIDFALDLPNDQTTIETFGFDRTSEPLDTALPRDEWLQWDVALGEGGEVTGRLAQIDGTVLVEQTATEPAPEPIENVFVDTFNPQDISGGADIDHLRVVV